MLGQQFRPGTTFLDFGLLGREQSFISKAPIGDIFLDASIGKSKEEHLLISNPPINFGMDDKKIASFDKEPVHSVNSTFHFGELPRDFQVVSTTNVISI